MEYNVLYTILIYPITQIIEFIFIFAQKLFKETGLSIVCISGAISILCLPLYMVAEKWQEVERAVQKRMAPKIAKIKAVFRGDERYMILSTFYRQNQYHPIYAMRSTFGLLIQVPFFIAAYSYLSHLDALRGVSFLFIADLGKPDALIGGFNLLPVLMTLINCTTGFIYTYNLAVKDKIQVWGISFLFLILLYNSPSGLVLYWTLNNIFSLIKNIYFSVKIPNVIKRTVLYSAVSLLCFLIILYIMIISSGVMRTRIVVSCVFFVIGIIPWILGIFNICIEKIQSIVSSKKDLIILFFLSCIALWLLTGLFIPSMLIVASPQEFSFIDTYTTPLFFIFNTALQSLGFCIFWTSLLFFLFSEKTKLFFTIALLCISCGALVNTFIFPGNYGLISINLIFSHGTGHNIKEILCNTSVLLLVFCILFVLFLLNKKKICIFLYSVSILALSGYSIINIVTINNEYNKLSQFYKPATVGIQEITPIFQLSKTGKNVVIMMLDRAAGVYMPYIFEESPELYEQYSGFTWYPNTVSFSAFTKDGAPPIFGGYEYTPLEINKRDTLSIIEKHNESLLMLPRIFADAGFSVTVTDPPYANGNWKPDLSIYEDYPDITAYMTDAVYTNYWLKEHHFDLPSASYVLKRNILWYSLFRTLPLAFRQSIYTDGNWCAPVTGHSVRITINGYSVLDYLTSLTGFSPEKENTALILVNNTTHADTFMQAPDYRPVLNSTNYGKSLFSKEMSYHTSAAAIKRLVDWFDFLKKEEVYDNTRIILVSDHGPTSNFTIRNTLPFDVDFIADYNPILFVKDFYADGNMKIDNSFMSNADTPSIALEGIIANPHNPFTGNVINMELKKKPLYIATGRIQRKSKTEIDINIKRDMYVHDNIFELKNWITADKYN